MAGYASQESQLGFRLQASEGVFADPGAASPNNGIFMKYRSGSLEVNRDNIEPDPEIGGSRDVVNSYNGPSSVSGDIEFYARLNSLPSLLYGVLGTKSSSTTGTTPGDDLVGTHVITPTDSTLDLPFYSFEQSVGADLETTRFTDCRFNNLSLEIEPEGYLMGTVSVVGRSILAGATRTASPVIDGTPLIVGTNCTVDIGGDDTYNLRSLSLELNNNIEDNVFALGKPSLVDLTPKRRELNLSMTIRPDDTSARALYREAVLGSAAATTPQGGAVATRDFTITMTSYEAIGTGVVTVYSLTLEIPKANIKPFTISPSGDDVIEFEIEASGIRPDPNEDIITATVVNGLAAVL